MKSVGPLSVVTFLGLTLAVAAPAMAQTDAPDVETREVIVVYAEPEEVPAQQIVDRLAPSTVLTINARGFEADTTGSVRQCTVGATRSCRNQIRVRFDGGGRAIFQYLVTDGDACRLTDDRCTLEINVGRRTATIDTVFVDEAPPPGRITVMPDTGLEVGDTIEIRATGFPAESTLSATICAAPATSGPRCGAPAPELEFVTDRVGDATTSLRLDGTAVGSDDVTCGRRTRCHLVVSSDEIGVRTSPVVLAFGAMPGARYDRMRLLIGSLAAIAALAAAVQVAVRSSWDPPAESDSSAIDDADYADLDLEADQFDAATTGV